SLELIDAERSVVHVADIERERAAEDRERIVPEGGRKLRRLVRGRAARDDREAIPLGRVREVPLHAALEEIRVRRADELHLDVDERLRDIDQLDDLVDLLELGLDVLDDERVRVLVILDLA